MDDAEQDYDDGEPLDVVTVDVGDGWVVDVYFDVVGGELEAVGVTYRSYGNPTRAFGPAGDDALTPKPVKATPFRALPIGAIVNEAVRDLVQRAEYVRNLADEKQSPKLAEYVRKRTETTVRAGERRGPGRPPVYGFDHFKKVADLYQEALDDPEWAHKPTEYVTAKMHVARSTAGNWVEKARNEYGLLDPTSKGVIPRPGDGSPVTPRKKSAAKKPAKKAAAKKRSSDRRKR